MNRRAITPEEVEEDIQRFEKRLETVSGDEAKKLQQTINILKYELAGMRDGTIKVFQRIPVRKYS